MRTNTFSAVFRIRHALAFAVHKYFNDKGFFYINTPIITASDAEGAGETFRVTTLDMENPPKNENGEISWQKFFEGSSMYKQIYSLEIIEELMEAGSGI